MYPILDEIERPQALPWTRHELGQICDYTTGYVPMAREMPVPRHPPPFPLAAYLVMVRGE